MKGLAGRAASRLMDASTAIVVGHIDADGISSAAIASSTLDFLDIEHEVMLVKKLDEELAAGLKAVEPELVWFTDLGSGSLEILEGIDCVITDHHRPSGPAAGAGRPRTLFDFDREPPGGIVHVNPHLAGRDGGTEISGAGVTYLVAREVSPELREMAHLAVVGAVGDMQDRELGRLQGLNREILADAVKQGTVEVVEDLNLFGRETRPVYKMLQYASDLQIDGITDDYRGSLDFLLGLGIDLKRGEEWRTWGDLRDAEKRTIIGALARLVPPEDFTGEVYLLPREEKGTELHEAKEYATLLNSCGRYDAGELGLAVCKGDRREALDLARGLRRGHRKQLVESLRIMEEIGVSQMEHIQFVHVGGMIRDTIVGTVAGMLFGSGRVDDSKPIFALAEADDGIKVSGRGTKAMVDAGLDLSRVMQAATEKLGCPGGGHSIAAGATIAPGQVEEFLELANDLVGQQLS